MAENKRDVRSLQLWPNGKTVCVSGDSRGDDFRIHDGYQDADGREATDAERRAVRVEELAEVYVEREIVCNDTALVDDLIKLGFESSGEVAGEFSMDNVSGLTVDPDDWTVEECKEWLEDRGHDLPDPNPWAMDRETLLAELDAEANSQLMAEHPNATDDDVREWVIADMDQEAVGGLDDWREFVRDNAEPGEVMQWFRVSSWLAKQLIAVGEVVLDNNYGTWWGRQACGQAVIMDGVFQRVAERHAD